MNRFVWDDAWTGEDKDGHYRAGCYVGAAAALLLGLVFMLPPITAALVGLAAGTAVAWGKEFYDLFAPGRTGSLQDALVTMAGAAVGAMGGAGVVLGLQALGVSA